MFGAGIGRGRRPAPVLIRTPAMPFKASAKCRNYIPNQKRRLTNWPAYEAGLRQRGS
ncbi:MAG: hypothetical protein QOF70_3730 [Acetobacteraceae bacterium]|jgi:hypothetical protein|nr:hypothetical protein [Acetobacteraceae bacterium]